MKMNADTFLDIVPRRSEIDFSYLEKYGSRDLYKIASPFENCNFKPGQSFEARITHIYDPSKFWMVIKHRELEIFQKYLFRFYYKNRTHYKIPSEKIDLNLYCVAFIDNSYYRGVILGFPTDYEEVQEVQVYFIDYGMMGMASISHIYYCSEKCFKVPQFSIRARLAGICPYNKNTWTSAEVLEFYKLVIDRVLVGFILNVSETQEVLEVIVCVNEENGSISVQDALKAKQCARNFHDREVRDNCKVKFPYLFPSHEAIESGKVPRTVSDAEYQQLVAPLETIFRRYGPKNV